MGLTSGGFPREAQGGDKGGEGLSPVGTGAAALRGRCSVNSWHSFQAGEINLHVCLLKGAGSPCEGSQVSLRASLPVLEPHSGGARRGDNCFQVPSQASQGPAPAQKQDTCKATRKYRHTITQTWTLAQHDYM